ncbi:MAG: FUSC family protein [Rhodopila sp.]
MAAGLTETPVELPAWLRNAVPLVVHGLRLWASVCLALFVAFWLELQNPFWAGTTAAIVCQPILGASLRKGWFRMIGTVIGAIVSVLITAAFPQSREGFLIALTAWGALCGFAASLLRNFAAYAASLSGYSAVIIGMDVLGSVGTGSPDAAFNLAVWRATEICIGIVSAGLVAAFTDIGRARGRLATVIATLVSETAKGLATSLAQPAPAQDASRTARRALIPQVAGLDTLIDNAIGESPALRFRPRVLQAAMDGLFIALSGWRGVATHIERRPGVADAEAPAILRHIPSALQSPADPAEVVIGAVQLRRDAILAARTLVQAGMATPSARLLADQTSIALLGVARALRGIAVLEDPMRAEPNAATARLRVPDMLPPLVNALRVVLAMGAAEALWLVTAWPSGGTAVIFAAVTVILFSPREDAAYDTARGFMLGNAITAVFAGIAEFFILPHQTTFLGFCLTIAVFLVPTGALSAGTWRPGMFLAMAANFIPVLGPANPMVFDPASFLNTATALVSGVAIAVISLRLLPPLPAAFRARRLAALTLRDLRRLAARPEGRSAAVWENHVYGRLTALPEQADTLQAARLVAALSTGSELIRLHHTARRLGAETAAAFTAIADGDSLAALEALQRLDATLQHSPQMDLALRMRGNIAAIRETLMQHAAYFNDEVAA